MVRPDGLLHAVKVEARVPRRCKGLCDYTGTGPVDWPKIETYSTGFLDSTRCYELRNHFGMTKARAVRFDQSPNVSKFKLFNKIPFVMPNFSHPDVGYGLNITGGDVFTVCAMHMDPLINDLVAPANIGLGVEGHLAEAFMINWQPRDVDTSLPVCSATVGPPCLSQTEAEELDCWDYVHEDILRFGVQSTSCANYYWGGPGGTTYGQQGMRVKFTPCNETFIESSDQNAPDFSQVLGY